jgi:hypothetical protein
MNEKQELLDGMTGSAFLAYTRRLAVAVHKGQIVLGEREARQVNLAVDVFGPEYFYMDGELFAG